MIRAFFKSFSPFLQLFLLFAIAFLSLMFFYFAGAVICNAIWNVDITDMQAITDYNNPNVLSSLRFLLVMQHVGYFILPALIFAGIISDNRLYFMHAQKSPSIYQIILLLGLVFFSFFVINALINVNSMLPLKGEFGSRLKAMHDENISLTGALMGSSSIGNYLLTIVVLAIIPALGEELLFRGIILKLFTRSTGNVHIGIWLTAILFSIMHLEILNFLPIVFMAVIFGYLLIWTGNIWVPIIAHFLNNVITVTLNYLVTRGVLSKDFELIGGLNQIWIPIVAVVLMGGILFIFYGNSQWKSIAHLYKKPQYKF